MDFVPLVALGALIWKVMDFLKAAKNKDWNVVLTQAIAWIAGIVCVVAFAASSNFGGDITVMGDLTLSSLSVIEQVIIGMVLSSSVSVGFDLKKALDNSDSAKTPPLTGRS